MSPRSRREQRMLMPCPPAEDAPPEHACALMERELRALDADIEAARRTARRVAAAGLPLSRPRPAAPPDGSPVRLARGGQVVIRPVGPQDRGRIARTFARLGALTRLRRFLVEIERLTPAQLSYLTDVDHVTHEALIALDPASGEAVGIARYVCDGDPGRARFAAVVVDAWQGRGLGSALLERLAARARANGVTSLVGTTVAGNAAAWRLLPGVTRIVSRDGRSGTLEVTIVLDEGAPMPAPAHDAAGPAAVPALAYAKA